ncbi:hypothetical protein MMS26_06245, partial [Escherichia coli]|nr:hypothetical protein [Escherichia coli]
QSSASSLSSGEYLPGSLQGKISSDGCLKKEQMVVSAIASTPHYFCRAGGNRPDGLNEPVTVKKGPGKIVYGRKGI